MPRYQGLTPASRTASERARASSRKSGTRCEVALAAALRRLRLSPSLCVAALPGRPDLVFARQRLAVFCDGDFWHGRGLARRLARLAEGHNPGYWVEKIRGNVSRDRRNRRLLRDSGWTVLRFWETDILRDPSLIASRIARSLRPAPGRSASRPGRGRGRSAPKGPAGGGGGPARASRRGAGGSSR
jgi:DNA mismatch endonuclease, patch repair protein